MLKSIAKSVLALLHPLTPWLAKKSPSPLPFLCIITPIFDEALPSLIPLVKDLQAQSYGSFIHVLISNGDSPKVQKYLAKISRRDPRFIYHSCKKLSTPNWQKLQVDLGRRKNYGLSHFDALRYVFIDADSSIIDRAFIAKLYISHRFLHKDILVARIRHGKRVLPEFPVRMGTLDMCNYTFSQKIAKTSHYPTDPWQYFSATDFLYFRDINTRNNTSFLPFTYLVKDSRRSYQSVGEKIRSSAKLINEG